jgi:K+-sensing histidine kinase KdpD
LSVSLSPAPVYLHMDVSRLCQAFHKLLVNTCRYAHPNGHIHVCASREGSTVSIVIGDTVKGIPATQRQSLGDQFLRGEQQALVEASLSLELYLARHFVEAHDGTVTAVSRGEHRGNGFRIELPCESSTALVPEPVSGVSATDRFPA